MNCELELSYGLHQEFARCASAVNRCAGTWEERPAAAGICGNTACAGWAPLFACNYRETLEER